MKNNTNIDKIKKIKEQKNIKNTSIMSLLGIIDDENFNNKEVQKTFEENSELVQKAIIKSIKLDLGNVTLEDENDYKELADIISKNVLKKLEKEDRIRDKKSLEKYVEKITKEHTDSVKEALKDEIKVLGYDKSEHNLSEKIKNLIAGKGNEARGYVERQKLKEARESKKKNMSDVFLKTLGRTKVGKKVRATNLFAKKKVKQVSKFIGTGKEKITNAINNSENLVFSKLINTVESLGGVDDKDKVKYNLNSNKKQSDIIKKLRTVSNNEFDSIKKTKNNRNEKHEKQSNITTLDNNIGDDISKTKTSLISIIKKNHKSILERLDKIDNELYDVIHKQDTSITKPHLSGKEKSFCSVIDANSDIKNEGVKGTEESGINGFDFNRDKKNRRRKSLSKRFRRTKASKLFGGLKSSKAIKASSKVVSGIASASKGLTKFLGPAAVAASVGLGAYNMYNATNDNELKNAAGGTIGSIAGGALGSLLGPLGTMAGAYIGSEVGGWVANTFFSDVDDDIPYEVKENPFTFKQALEIKRAALINQANNSNDSDFIDEANKKIKEIDKEEKEIVDNSNLEDWLEKAIEIKKKQPKSKGKSQDDIARSIILTVPVEYQDKLVKIYNEKIVGGLFTKNGNLTLNKNKTKKEPKKKNSSILNKIGSVAKNALAFSPILMGANIVKDVYSNKGNNKDNNNEFSYKEYSNKEYRHKRFSNKEYFDKAKKQSKNKKYFNKENNKGYSNKAKKESKNSSILNKIGSVAKNALAFSPILMGANIVKDVYSKDDNKENKNKEYFDKGYSNKRVSNKEYFDRDFSNKAKKEFSNKRVSNKGYFDKGYSNKRVSNKEFFNKGYSNKAKKLSKNSSILNKIGSVAKNALAFSPILMGANIVKDVYSNKENKSVKNVYEDKKIINTNNNSNINKLNNKTSYIKVPNRVNNVNLNLRTKELINELSTEIKGEKTVKEIIKEVPVAVPKENSGATVSLNNFSDHKMDVIVSEIIGGQ